MGRRRKGRQINGVLLLNKPVGGSSNQILQRVKRLYFAAKAGHTGALDPLASGMLPICLGEATKFSQFLLDADKTYQVTATLGIRTTTSDADGDVVEEKPVDVNLAQLEEALEQFRGPIKQVPSMFSALKHNGQPLYVYARQGITIEREARDIEIYALELLRFEGNEVDLNVHCSKGTYIRSLVDDLGQVLGCGAFVSMLHRSQVTDYPADKMISLEQLEQIADETKGDFEEPLDANYQTIDELLLPMDTAVSKLPIVDLNEEQSQFYRHGGMIRFAAKIPGLHRVFDLNNTRFLGVGSVDESGALSTKRLVVYSE
ncbi:tRNA pseudouridine(55) synthase TruB [Alteromonadaceae bacterium M269]|nr:tRNA pseudouridine(55) synthase TruB [Alteromonadaceae bacterium M269]